MREEKKKRERDMDLYLTTESLNKQTAEHLS